MANAMGKSRWVPSLRSSAGARLMTTLCLGKLKYELRKAERIRSRLSSMILLARPTMLKQGRPCTRSPSTVTRRPV